MERRSLLVYFDMRLEEDRDLLQRLRPYIVSRRGTEFIKAAIREKFERVAGSQLKTGGFGSRPSLNTERRLSDELEASPVGSGDMSAAALPSSPLTTGEDNPPLPSQGLVAPPVNTETSDAAQAIEAIRSGDATEPHGVSMPDNEAPVQAVTTSERPPLPRPRLGRLM